MDPIHELANAIIELAAKDYRKALKDLKRNPNNKKAKAMKEDCEKFFRSKWFGVLTTVDPHYLMDRLQMEVA